jgi:hypothetical protein
MKVPCIADVKAGDSKEDAEARSLLNKFLGAQVILQGMEPLVKASQSHSAALVSQAERQRVLTSQKVGLEPLSSICHCLHTIQLAIHHTVIFFSGIGG